jgi:uncharacterized protein YuzE
MRIEHYDDGEVLYLVLDTDGDWARSEFPDELVTLDYNEAGDLIGVEVVGSAAHAGLDALVKAITSTKGVKRGSELKKILQAA